MRTLLLAPELFTTDSGIPRMLRLYLKALCDLAGATDRVRFVTLNDTFIDSNDLRHYTGPRLAEWLACNRSKRSFVLEALRLSRKSDLIICGHIAQLPIAWLASLLRPGLRYQLVAHGIEVWRPFTFLERRALKGAQRILCVSEFTRREITRRFRLNPARLLVLPNALDPFLDAEADSPLTGGTAPVILTVSRLSASDRYKGIDHLIEAMPAILLEEPQARLRIVGRGDDAQRLQNLARQHRVDKAVEFAGFVDDVQLRREFARARLFALPSEKEGFGLVYLEAMAYGKPCLGARAGGAPEVIAPGCGVLVDYGHIPEIAAACVQALRRTWDPAIIVKHMENFSYPRFRERLAPLLTR